MSNSIFDKPLTSKDIKNREESKENFVIKGFLRGTIGLLVANEGAGKSGLAHLIATDIACGLNLSGLDAVQGKVIVLSLEDRESDWKSRQKTIELDLNDKQIDQVEKNMRIHDLKDHIYDLSKKDVYRQLLESSKEFKPDLIIIDYLEKWSRKELKDVEQAKETIKLTEEVALNLNCGILFLHHTNKGCEEEKGTRAIIGGATQYQQASKWTSILRKDKKSKNENCYELEVSKSRTANFKVCLNRRPERMGIPYAETSQNDPLLCNKEENVVDLSSKGGRYPNGEVAPMCTALIKQEGIFASFSPNQERPKLDVKIDLGEKKWVRLLGPDMLGSLEAKILVAITAKLNKSGILLCIPNGSKKYDTFLDKVEEYSSYSMEVDTTIYQIHKELSNRKGRPDSRTYHAVKNSLMRLRATTVFYRNGNRESALNLIEYYDFEVSENKFSIKLNPFLVDAILGLGGISYTKIPVSIIKNIKSDTAFILYQRIMSIVRKTDKKGIVFNIDTLLNYLFASKEQSPGMRKERLKSLRKAIKELEEKTEFKFLKEGRFNYRISHKSANGDRSSQVSLVRRGS
ncbi:MAG: replication protein C, IncQ-type [Oligoflexales bacterium]